MAETLSFAQRALPGNLTLFSQRGPALGDDHSPYVVEGKERRVAPEGGGLLVAFLVVVFLLDLVF